MNETNTVVIRPYKPYLGPDNAMIYSTWISALWYALPENTDTDSKVSHVFYKEKAKRIRQLLASKEVVTRIACLGDDPDLMIGYSVVRNKNVEFVYVKIDYRRRGIGKLLTMWFETVSNPQTRMGKKLVKKMNLKIQGEPDGKTDQGT